MPKSRGEIQKAYRERKKAKEGSKYLKKETERVKRYYKPTTEITPAKLKIRRQRVRDCMRKMRQKHETGEKPQNIQQNESNEVPRLLRDAVDNNPGPCDSTSSGVVAPSTSSLNQEFKVKMNFKRKDQSKGRAISKSKLKLRSLEQKVKNLTKRNETLRKRIYRGSSQKSESVKSTPKKRKSKEQKGTEDTTTRKRKINNDNEVDLTPRSKSKIELRQEGLSPTKHPKLMKKTFIP